MNEITRLLAAGYDVEFYAPDTSGTVDCILTTPAGDAVTATGDTWEAALADASPLPPDPALTVAAVTEIWQDGYRHAGADSALIEKLEAEASVTAGALEDIKERLEKLEGAPADGSPFTVAERLASLEIWAEGIVRRLDMLEGRASLAEGLIEDVRTELTDTAEDLEDLKTA